MLFILYQKRASLLVHYCIHVYINSFHRRTTLVYNTTKNNANNKTATGRCVKQSTAKIKDLNSNSQFSLIVLHILQPPWQRSIWCIYIQIESYFFVYCTYGRSQTQYLLWSLILYAALNYIMHFCLMLIIFYNLLWPHTYKAFCNVRDRVYKFIILGSMFKLLWNNIITIQVGNPSITW